MPAALLFIFLFYRFFSQLVGGRIKNNQSRTKCPINAHLTTAQVMPKYNHNNEKQEALL